jgi:hypothetical protein
MTQLGRFFLRRWQLRMGLLIVPMMARDALHAAVVLLHELDSICSFDRDFDLVRSLRRVSTR